MTKSPILFAVSQDQPFVTGKDAAKFKYVAATDAERAARRAVKLHGGEMNIWVNQPLPSEVRQLKHHGYSQLVATVLTDALDRVWTQVPAGPGQQSFL